ncbi:hypothetical protein E5S69_29945 [Cupriavidus necator]|uniref:TadG family pilus assembly protein n=1 Tax=Cupriavidus necator TaxID=106590 RepID=UPI00148F87D7|nr:TadG family pilus assembly protein [Cupriavidus necator]NOV27710.1 hypothetical protein [Cupriavidus necator]
MSLRQPPVRRTRRCARGAVSVMAALLIATVAIAALVSIDVGHVFMRQRQLQNMADLAAMSAAQQLKRADSAANLNAAVLGTVSNIGAKNGYPSGIAMGCAEAAGGGADAMTACVGVWDPATAGPRHFNAAYNPATVSPNAVRVQATQTVPILFVFNGGSGRRLFAESIASGSPPVAAFSLGTGLLDVSTANGMLSVLLGSSVQLSAADWQGLVNANVTLDQLRLRANVGTVNQLLNTALSLRDFYALVLGAAGRDALLNTMLGSPPTTLGAGGAGVAVSLAQLLQLGVLAPAASSAAEAGLSVAQLLLAGAQVARGDTAVALPVTGQLPAGLGGLSASVQVIQPPVMAVGPARKLTENPTTWQTSAHSAQVEVALAATVSSGPISGLLGLQLNVPLHIAAAEARADLTGLQCAAAPADRRATVHVTPSLISACLTNQCAGGKVTIGTASTLFYPLIKLVVVDNPKQRSAAGTDVTLAPGGHAQVGTANPIGGIFSQVLALQVTPEVLGVPIPLPLDLSAVLVPLGTALDAILPSVLAQAGIQLGNADLWVHSIDCNNAELVY